MLYLYLNTIKNYPEVKQSEYRLLNFLYFQLSYKTKNQSDIKYAFICTSMA
jgi:hypothetical protein